MPAGYAASATMRLSGSTTVFRAAARLSIARPALTTQRQRRCKASKAYEGHVPLNGFERAFLTVGSALASLVDPARADMIATLSEVSAGPFLPRLRDQMLESESGRRLLRERPRITSQSVRIEALRELPEGTVGKEYVRWLEWCKVTPDTRLPVKFIDDPELAYVMQRYRECHDFYHLITGPFPVSLAPEVVVKVFEFANMGLPVALLSSIGGPMRLEASERRSLLRTYLPWALRCGSSCQPLICVEWEKLWDRDIEEVRRELGITKPPEWKAWRRAERERKQREQALAEAAANASPASP